MEFQSVTTTLGVVPEHPWGVQGVAGAIPDRPGKPTW